MPILKPAPCWTRFVEFNTNIAGTCALLRGMAEVNVEDIRDNPKLRADLDMRLRAALIGTQSGDNAGLGALPKSKEPPLRYKEEPVDMWQAYSVLAENAPGQTIVADCDCLSPTWAGWFWDVVHLPFVGIGISQPKTRPCCEGSRCSTRARKKICGHGMAHAFTVIGALDARDPKSGELYVPAGLRKLLVPYNGRPEVGVFDGSAFAGMPSPRDGFYGSGESAIRWLRDEEESERALAQFVRENR